jgi:hypothetical protein
MIRLIVKTGDNWFHYYDSFTSAYSLFLKLQYEELTIDCVIALWRVSLLLLAYSTYRWPFLSCTTFDFPSTHFDIMCVRRDTSGLYSDMHANFECKKMPFQAPKVGAFCGLLPMAAVLLLKPHSAHPWAKLTASFAVDYT